MSKMSKKEIYASFGIEYRSGKLVTPFNMEIEPLLKNGTNTKIGNASTFSIYHGNETLSINDFKENGKTQAVMKSANITEIKASCPFHCKGCYCDNGNYNYDSTKASLMINLTLCRIYPYWTERAMKAQLVADEITQVRIHASGDFFSGDYVDMWKRIIVANPLVTFWTYTKEEHALHAFQNIGNISIVPSLTPCGFNFGTCAELLEKYNAITAMGKRVHICACGTDFQTHCADCKHGCKAIGKECDCVLFIKHSTRDYKANKDDKAEFAQVVEIIKAQDN